MKIRKKISILILTIKRLRVVRVLMFPFMRVHRNSLLKNYCTSKDAKKLETLYNKMLGQRCFIIGNGPSLTLNDLEKLNNEFTFSANRIYSLFDKTEWRPKAYVCTDKESFKIYGKYIKELSVPYKFLDIYGKRKYGSSQNTFYIYSHSPFSIKFNIAPYFSKDISNGISTGQTVTFTSIQIAVYMGFKEIYLLGVDNCYNKIIDKSGKVHFNNGVKNYSSLIEDTGLGVQFIDGTTKAYTVSKKYCERNGIIIKNATRGGKLEIFERIDFDSLAL